MSPDTLREKKLIALAIDYVIEKVKGVSLVQVDMVGASYPYTPDVPGVWVLGPDNEGRFTVEVHIAVARENVMGAADQLRSEVWHELRERGIADRVGSVDIYVEDLILAV